MTTVEDDILLGKFCDSYLIALVVTGLHGDNRQAIFGEVIGMVKRHGDLLQALIDGKTLESSNGDQWSRRPDGTLRFIRDGNEVPVNDRAFTIDQFIRWVNRTDIKVLDKEDEFSW